jgi:4-hydroxy-tetrahydrodipicolinate synthase
LRPVELYGAGFLRSRSQLSLRRSAACAFDHDNSFFRAWNILESGKFVQKIKFGCALQGLQVGECRAPLGPLSEAEKAEFRAAMEPILNWPG